MADYQAPDGARFSVLEAPTAGEEAKKRKIESGNATTSNRFS